MTPHRRTYRAAALVSTVAVAIASAAVGGEPAQALDPLPLPGAGFHEGVYVPLDDVPVGEQGDAAVVANGNLALTWAGSHFEGTVDKTISSPRSTPASGCAGR